ncbi:MAG: hypothetical protein WAZ34_13560 [Rhodocyclaceae bacterium]
MAEKQGPWGKRMLRIGAIDFRFSGSRREFPIGQPNPARLAGFRTVLRRVKHFFIQPAGDASRQTVLFPDRGNGNFCSPGLIQRHRMGKFLLKAAELVPA